MDKWLRWLLQRRWGDGVEHRNELNGKLAFVRDQVLDHAAIQPGHTVLDVGCGDGLIAFGALERVGQAGKVIFSDISSDALDYCKARVMEREAPERTQFVCAPADSLSAIPSGSVDRVTARSVLIYVVDKQAALCEMFRVLKPAGRVSLFEPIESYRRRVAPTQQRPAACAEQEAIDKIVAFYGRSQLLACDPMVNFNEHDLFTLIENAGFVDV